MRCRRPGQRVPATACGTRARSTGSPARLASSSSRMATSRLSRWCAPGSGSRRCSDARGRLDREPVAARRLQLRGREARAPARLDHAGPERPGPARTTRRGVSASGPTTVVRPARSTPAFSRAISASVRPRYTSWSRSRLTIAEAIGSATFVASSWPPRPTSSTATSTRALRKWAKAAAVSTSKKVGWPLSAPRLTRRARRPSPRARRARGPAR